MKETRISEPSEESGRSQNRPAAVAGLNAGKPVVDVVEGAVEAGVAEALPPAVNLKGAALGLLGDPAKAGDVALGWEATPPVNLNAGIAVVLGSAAVADAGPVSARAAGLPAPPVNLKGTAAVLARLLDAGAVVVAAVAAPAVKDGGLNDTAALAGAPKENFGTALAAAAGAGRARVEAAEDG